LKKKFSVIVPVSGNKTSTLPLSLSNSHAIAIAGEIVRTTPRQPRLLARGGPPAARGAGFRPIKK